MTDIPTEIGATSYVYTPIEPPTPKKARRWPWIVAIVVALIVGAALGSGGGDTKTVTETKTVTNDVPSTPESCITALDQADKLLTVSSQFATTTGDALGAASDGFTAIANSDVAGIEAATTRMQNVSSEIHAETEQVQSIGSVYRAARDECTSS